MGNDTCCSRQEEMMSDLNYINPEQYITNIKNNNSEFDQDELNIIEQIKTNQNNIIEQRNTTNTIIQNDEFMYERIEEPKSNEKNNKKMEDMQKEKEKISIQKRIMGNNLAERKKLLMDKVSNILTTGHFKSKEDIYRKVFNEDELQTLGYSLNKTITSNNSRMKRTSKMIKTEGNY